MSQNFISDERKNTTFHLASEDLKNSIFEAEVHLADNHLTYGDFN